MFNGLKKLWKKYRRPKLRLASAYLIDADGRSGQKTEKEYISYQDAIKNFSRAAEEGRVIWPCPPLSSQGIRVFKTNFKETPAWKSRMALRGVNEEKANRAFGLLGLKKRRGSLS